MQSVRSVSGFAPLIRFLAKLTFTVLSVLGLQETRASDHDQLVEQVRPAVAYLTVLDASGRSISSGNGFFVSEDGLLITNFHIVERGARINVEMDNGAIFTVDSLQAYDVDSDLALFRVKGKRLPTLNLHRGTRHGLDGNTRLFVLSRSSDKPVVSALGVVSPLGHSGNNEGPVRLTIQTEGMLSGAPVCTLTGQVLGVSSVSFQNGATILHAIPVELLTRLMDKAERNSEITALPLESGQSSAEVEKKPTAKNGNRKLALSDFSRFMAIFEGDKGKGSGFVGKLNGTPLLFTNSHVLSGNREIQAKLLDGSPLKLKGLSVATTYDVSVFAQESTMEGLDILENMDRQVAIGDEVIVLGNSLGGGVVTELRGKVQGIGPELIEVDAKFVFGNSGSPVIHVKTGKAIGIATFSIVRTLTGAGKDSEFNQIERRFAYRLDNIPRWQNIGWSAFRSESEIIGRFRERTDQVWALAVDISKNGRVTQWSAYTQRGNALALTATTWQRVLGRASISSELTAEKRRFVAGVIMTLRADLGTIRRERLTGYHQKVYDDTLREREMLKDYFHALEEQFLNDPRFLSR